MLNSVVKSEPVNAWRPGMAAASPFCFVSRELAIMITSICQRLFTDPQSIIMQLYAVGLWLVRCLPIIPRRITKTSVSEALITAFPATLDACNTRRVSASSWMGLMSNQAYWMWVARSCHHGIKWASCLRGLDHNYIFVILWGEKHRQFILEDPVLEQLLTALWWGMEDHRLLVFLSLSFKGIGW